MTCAHAQTSEAGPLETPAGKLQFVRDNHGFAAMLDAAAIDRFDARTLTHYDDTGDVNDFVTRVLVQTDAGPVLYDFRRRPVQVQRVGERMALRRVFWQGDEVVMQSSRGWYRFRNGELTKLQSTTTIYH